VLHAIEEVDPALRSRFEAEHGAALREACPAQPHGTPLELRRVVVVATRTG
jgi:trans-aconitate 2-methyltransferase